MAALDGMPAAISRAAPVVVVLGDLVLDRWWLGTSRRLSREAPVPVVELSDRRSSPGGAGNAAANLGALGARVRLVGAVGDDAAGGRLSTRLRRSGVELDGVVRVRGRRTPTKTRVVADDQVLVRADHADASAAPDGATARGLQAALRAALAGADALLVSDYGSAELGVVAAAPPWPATARPPLVVVDAHDATRWRDWRPDLVVPNAAEAEEATGRPGALGRGPARRAAAEALGPALLSATGARGAVVTLDRDGAIVLDGTRPPPVTSAHPAPERFASGAGDTFAATLTAALASGAGLDAAAALAQLASDVAVRRLGTSTCTNAELAAALAAPPTRTDLDVLAAEVERDRRDGLRIVFTNGCFDVLHRGHTDSLREARSLGDRLIVAVNSDASVRRLKGEGRPLNGERDRAAVVAALEWVDDVIVFDDDTPIALLERLRPDVYAKGGDYSPSMLAETPVVRAYGGEVRITGYVPDHSTTTLVHRIRTGEAAR